MRAITHKLAKMSAQQYITHNTRIVNLGHMPGHTRGKEELLRKEGFTKVESLLFEEHTISEIQQKLKGATDTLFLIGGAMMGGFPTEMKAILDFVKEEAPEIIVYITSKSDFPEGSPSPPTQEIVNQSAVTIAKKLLKPE